jgi:prepilin-type N-terminal cleavage/methylation domain-containing protein
MEKNIFTTNRGYTVLETLVAVSIFSVIAVAGAGALLHANLVHQKSQDMRTIIDSMSFIMEEVSRNLRTGYDYRCIYDGNYSSSLDVARSCTLGAGIAFEHGDFGDPDLASDQWLYKVETGNIFKSIDSGTNWIQLNPPEVVLSGISGFSVLGAEPPGANTQQPLVTIKLVGSITYKTTVSPFSLETAVSQRLIDAL